MTGRRRRGMLPPARPPQGYVPGAGKTVLVDGIPEGAIPNPEPVQTATQVIVLPSTAQIPEPAWMAGADAAVREGQDQAERGDCEQHDREPVPDLDWDDPADRTEWFRLHEGYETCFASVLNDHPEWLRLLGLPLPVSNEAPEAAQDTKIPVPETAPPVGASPAPAVSGTVSSEDEGEPVQDEPAAEPDCAEGADA